MRFFQCGNRVIDGVRRREDLPQRKLAISAVVQGGQQDPRIFGLPLWLESGASCQPATGASEKPFLAHSYQGSGLFEAIQSLAVILLRVLLILPEPQIGANLTESCARVTT